MKRLLLGIALLFAVGSFAQSVRYGVKAGINFSTLQGDDFDNASGRYGFAAGFFAQIPLSESLKFQPELLYSGQGIKPNSLPGSVYAERAELDYLQLPLLLSFNAGKVYFQVGPQVGLGIWNSFNNETYKNYDISGLGGIGYQIMDGLSLEARYSMGFMDVVNGPAEGKNSYFAIMAAYRL